MILLYILAAFIVGGALALWLGSRVASRADRSIRAWATSRGLPYAVRDDTVGTLPWGPPFGVGYKWLAQNVVSGDRHGRPVLCFNFRYDVKRGTKADSHHFCNVVAVHGPELVGDLDVASRSVGPSPLRALPDSGQQLESDRFNASFRIGGDPKFVSDVLHPRMMQWLLDTSSPGFRIHDSWFVLVRPGWLDAGRLDTDLAQLQGVIDRVPGFLWRSA